MRARLISKRLSNCGLYCIVCNAVLGLGFIAFFVSLDRYPQIYPDDSFYNYPAISYLEGKGFKYKVANAPHGDSCFGYHAPIFPHLQVAVFRQLGASQFTFRATQYISAYLAITILCNFLIARRLPLAAVVLAASWLGDRSSQEVMLGRMEGLALLCLAGGFLGLVNTIELPSLRRAVLCGVCTAAAAAVHPVAAVFAFIAVGCLAVFLRGGVRIRAMTGYGLGTMAAVALVVWLWWPHVTESLEQFQWSITQQTDGQFATTQSARILHLWRVLGWAKYWTLALALASVAVLVPVSLTEAWKSRFTAAALGRRTILVVASAFALAGLACVAKGGQAYYLVYFTVWPALALAVFFEQAANAKDRRLWTAFAAAVLAAAWAPSLLWNGLRFRESMLYRDQIAHERFTEQLAAVIPKRARVVSIPELLIIGKEGGLNVTPAPWHEERAQVGDDAWLLVKEAELVEPRWIAAECLASRKVFFLGEAFPGAPGLGYRFAVLGPADAARTSVSLYNVR